MTRPGQVVLRDIVKRHGAVAALHGINLEIPAGEFFALLGPSGSGKTTTLRIIAGLDEPTEGRVLLDGTDVTHAEPGDRDVAMVFQSYALYPHMTVFQNIAFPLRMVGTAPAAIEGAVRDAAEKVHIAHLLDRKPGQLSGGQQQRCALARAIVRKPRLFLLDEPLSNLDAKLRLETRGELKKLQRSLGVTAVYVTHDQEEAMTVADRMAIFMDGRIAQVGTPDEVFQRPGTIDVAVFLGSPPMNLLEAQVQGRDISIGGQRLRLDGDLGVAREIVAGIRPSALTFADTGLAGRVDLIEHLGEATIVSVLVGDKTVRVRSERRPPVSEGQNVRLSFDPSDLHFFDASTGARV